MYYGPHLIFDGYGASLEKLFSMENIYEFLLKMPEAIGMRRVGLPHLLRVTEKEIEGISGFVFIMESHISLHTYSQKGFITIDVYSCKPFDEKACLNLIQEYFECDSYESKLIWRGSKFN